MYKKSSIPTSKKVIIPGINVRTILPLASLLKPKDLIITMSLVSLLAQISNSLKGVLEFKEIAQLPSVKFYSKLLMCGVSSLSLNSLYALSKTLGAELETLSTLSDKERFYFLQSLQKSIFNQKISPNIISNYRAFNDPYQLLKFRKALSLQSRSIMVSNSIYIPHSVVFGLPVEKIDIAIILNSCKLIWSYLSLYPEDFELFLKKEAYSYLFSLGSRFKSFFELPLKSSDCVKLLLMSEFELFQFFDNTIVFDEDYVILRDENNLTPLFRTDISYLFLFFLFIERVEKIYF